MADSSNSNGNFGDSGVIEFTGKVMVVAIILLFFIVVFVFSIHLYTKWFWRRRIENTRTTTTRRMPRLDFTTGHYEITIVPALRRGLDTSILKTLPLTVFDPKDFKDGLECAVCLSEISEGEKIRVLPKCNHRFHLECIDMWFQSHPTCPLCRNPVANPNQSNIHSGESALENMLYDNSNETPNFPTNVLFWGDETQVSAFDPCAEETRQGSSNAISEPSSSSLASTSNRANGILMIDIAREVNEDQEEKSQVSMRFRSLRRLFSGTRRVNPSIPRNLDIEQGGSGQT